MIVLRNFRNNDSHYASYVHHSIILISFSFLISNAIGGELLECPGLPTRIGINLECISTKLGALKFNCSSPMPVDTVVFFGCQQYYKEKGFPNPFDMKNMRCNKQGRWARYNYFREFKCEYECGKAMPNIKTSVVRGQLKTLTTWSWHALIYVKLNWAKVLEAIQYRKALQASAASRKYGDGDPYYGEGLEGEDLSTDKSFALDPVKLAEIFENDDLSREEIFDPRYRYIYICGGTLISERMVLTAAHCLTDLKGLQRASKDFMVVLGGTSNDFYDNMDDPKSQIIPVHKLHISDEFSYDDYLADIGIIELEQSAVLNSAVLPACLPENRDDARSFIASKKQGEVIGSMINIYREGISNELKSKKLQVLPNLECKNIERIPSDGEFCAGSVAVNICSGDSGGGLISTPNFGLRRRYTVQGIISYARTRRVCESYAVFTRVYKHLNWIKSVVFENAISLPS